jgi:hypothetical protein
MDTFHTYLQKRVAAALKMANTAIRKEEDKIEKGRAAVAKRDHVQGRRDDITRLGEEMDALILEHRALTDPGEIAKKRRAIRRKAARVDKKQQELSDV